MDTSPAVGRCVECHSDISVPESYAHGDRIRCGSCGTHHKVLRTPALKLVLADVSRLQESLKDLQTRISRRQDELRGARGSLGMGVHGLYFGVVWVIYQLGLRDRPLEVSLFVEAVVLALVAATLLELANYFFFAKRQRIEKLTEEIADLHQEGLEIRRKIREAQRG